MSIILIIALLLHQPSTSTAAIAESIFSVIITDEPPYCTMPLTTSLQREEVEVAYSSDDHESLPVTPLVPLLDIESAVEIPKDVADGYIILLSGGSLSARMIKEKKLNKGKKTKVGKSTAASLIDESAVDFAFAALTDGNVIEAVFGVESNGGLKRSKNTSEFAYNAARNAKQAIMDASIPTESVKKLAVETYIRLFEIIIGFHLDLENIGFITWCVKHQKVEISAIKEIHQAFVALNEVIASSI
eukprot:scaffold361_cov265-Chaetoceros_neogracile.AAC.35